MTDQEEQALKEARRKEKRATEEIEQLAKDQARRKDTITREQAIEEDQKERKTKQAEKRATEEIRQSARDQQEGKMLLLENRR